MAKPLVINVKHKLHLVKSFCCTISFIMLKRLPILAVVLVVASTCLPAPREASNPKGSGSAEKQKNTQTSAQPSSPISTISAQPSAQSSKYASQPKNSKDGWDKAAVLSNYLLFLVGVSGIIYAARTLAALKKQTKATEDAAKAALTQIDISRQKERPRLRIDLTNVALNLQKSPDTVDVAGTITNYGGSIAFVFFSSCFCWISDDSTGLRAQAHRPSNMRLPEIISPGQSCQLDISVIDEARGDDKERFFWDKDDPRLDAVRRGEKVIYVDGAVMYNNIFDETWIVGFKRRFIIYGFYKDIIPMWRWEHCGDLSEEYESKDLPKQSHKAK